LPPFNFDSWRQAFDVAGYSLRREFNQRAKGARTLGGSLKTPSPIEWDVINRQLPSGRFRYRVTNNITVFDEQGNEQEPIWAINIHGFFAGGSMYARESEQLAARLGWRVVNPSLPGFGGSAPLGEAEISLERLTDFVDIVRGELGIKHCVLLGHSMGAAVAVQYAIRHPDEILALIYRDGVATPQWQVRNGVSARALSHIVPDAAQMVDLVGAVALDVPDLLVGHLFTTVKALLPDLRSNVSMIMRAAPVAEMLRSIDLTTSVKELVSADIPIYPVWGCFDRVIANETAAAFSEVTGVPIQWVPGGHSWMLARPSGQSDLLTIVPSGVSFNEIILERARTRRATPRVK
jgi:pimeloyl-ACP methyl ester carboxylesterase